MCYGVMSLKLCLYVLRFNTERLHLKVDYIIIILIVNQYVKHFQLVNYLFRVCATCLLYARGPM